MKILMLSEDGWVIIIKEFLKNGLMKFCWGYMRRSKKISAILFLCLFNFYSESSLTEGLSLEKLDLLQDNINSFRVEFEYLVRGKKTEFIQKVRGRCVFEENMGYLKEVFVYHNDKEEKTKIIDNFSQGIHLTYNYSKNTVEMINYKTISSLGNFAPNFIYFEILDFFMPFRYNSLVGDLMNKEGVERIGDREFEIISGVIAKYPLLGNKCKIWIAKDNNFVYKFFIYNEESEPIFTLEVTKVEINPEIDDKEFSAKIPPDFKEVDVTEQFAWQYRILVQLYRVYAENKELQKRIEELEEEIVELIGGKETGDVSEKLSLYELIQKEPSILFIDRELDFMIIGGKEENLRLGNLFEVYRGNRLLGKIEITRIYQDMAVAEPVTEGLIKIIREGDRLVKSSEED